MICKGCSSRSRLLILSSPLVRIWLALGFGLVILWFDFGFGLVILWFLLVISLLPDKEERAENPLKYNIRLCYYRVSLNNESLLLIRTVTIVSLLCHLCVTCLSLGKKGRPESRLIAGVVLCRFSVD